MVFAMGVHSDAPLWVPGWLSICTCIVWVQRLALLSYFFTTQQCYNEENYPLP